VTRASRTLDSVCLRIVDCEHKTAPVDTDGEFFAVGTPAMRGHRINFSEARRISAETFAAWTRRMLPMRGDLLFAREAPVGPIVRIPARENVAPGQRTVLLRPDPEQVDTDYLYYLFTSPRIQAEVQVKAEGSTVPHLNVADVRAFELPPLPPLPEQRAIAATLGVLDDKIESNRRAVALIEDLVAAEFTRLVTEFEPTYVPLGELTDVVKGRSYKSAELEQSTTALVTLKSIDRNGGYKADGLKPYSGPYKENQVIRPGEMVVAQTDLTQGAEVVGRGVRVPAAAGFETLVASLDLAIVRPNEGMPIEYLRGLLTSEGFRQWCRSRVTGTTVLHLAKDAIPTWPAPVVAHREQQRFASFARALLDRMDSLEAESHRLATLRDALLPELLSGRIRVPVDEAA